MSPAVIKALVIAAIAAALIAFGFATGWKVNGWRYEAKEADAQKAAQKLEDARRAAADAATRSQDVARQGAESAHATEVETIRSQQTTTIKAVYDYYAAHPGQNCRVARDALRLPGDSVAPARDLHVPETAATAGRADAGPADCPVSDVLVNRANLDSALAVCRSQVTGLQRVICSYGQAINGEEWCGAASK